MLPENLHFALIDDDKVILQILSSILNAASIRTSLYHSATTAIIDIQGKVDCVITDINMAGMDGFNLIKEMKGSEEFDKTKFIVITAAQGDKWKQKSKDAGAHGYITKPFDTNNIMKQIEAIYSSGR